MSGGGEQSGREGAEERGREGGRRKRGGGSRGEEGRRPARQIAWSCKRAPGAFPGAGLCVRAPFCSSHCPRGRGRGDIGRRARGRRPPSKPPAKCLGRHNQAACSAEQATRPGLSERTGLVGSAAVASGCRCPGRRAWAHHAPAGPGRRAQADSRLAPASTRSD